MSFHVFFEMSTGLKKTLRVPPGTEVELLTHVLEVEQGLGLKRTQYKKNPVHWDLWLGRPKDGWPVSLTNDLLCRLVEEHNCWVRRTYCQFETWTKTPPKPSEALTPKQATAFWHGLTRLHVSSDRWSEDYYRARMEALYEVMRGRECEGMTFDVKTLTPKQAAAVINLFSQHLDVGDQRLDVPHGHDFLASSADGGYEWCAGEGAKRSGCYRPIDPDDIASCRRKVCPLREEEA